VLGVELKNGAQNNNSRYDCSNNKSLLPERANGPKVKIEIQIQIQIQIQLKQATGRVSVGFG